MAGLPVGFRYDAAGIKYRRTIDDVLDRSFLIDAANHTGYAQIIQERDATDAKRSFVIGDDMLSQVDHGTDPTPDVFTHLLYDGHGSTRDLVDGADSSVLASYDYDAYGNALGFNPAIAATALQYTGEEADQTGAVGMTYLRARWYDAGVGRFGKVDPFCGDKLVPMSLHKYMYTYADPMNAIDPSGQMTLADALLAMGLITATIGLAVTGIGLATGNTGVRNFGLVVLSIGLGVTLLGAGLIIGGLAGTGLIGAAGAIILFAAIRYLKSVYNAYVNKGLAGGVGLVGAGLNMHYFMSEYTSLPENLVYGGNRVFPTRGTIYLVPASQVTREDDGGAWLFSFTPDTHIPADGDVRLVYRTLTTPGRGDVQVDVEVQRQRRRGNKWEDDGIAQVMPINIDGAAQFEDRPGWILWGR